MRKYGGCWKFMFWMKDSLYEEKVEHKLFIFHKRYEGKKNYKGSLMDCILLHNILSI